MSESIFEELSAERKKLQKQGKLPDWFTTVGWQTFKGKYLHEADTFEEQIDRIVKTVGKYAPSNRKYFKRRWKELIMNNHAYLATPTLANIGTNRGMGVSCSGGDIPDSVYGFGDARLECSILSQEGFGTSSYLGNIRERGAPISRGGKANGVLPVFEDMVRMAENISQGGARRGAWAGYLPMEHGDFWEVAGSVKNDPDGANVGWNIHDSTIAKLNSGDEDTIARFQRSLSLKMVAGRGYYYFPDKVARAAPQMYKDLGLRSVASNLCTEITLHADEEHSYSCVLSGMVASSYDEWKNTDAVYCMTIFLDCLVSEFLDSAKDVRGLERIIRGTEKGRALGLGMSGIHTYFQKNMMPYGGIQAHMKNIEMAKHLNKESLRASQWMASQWGEPEWCKGYGVRNTHRIAYAPNLSSATIFGSESQGCGLWFGNVYTESGAAGGMFRVNPLFIELLKKHGKYDEETINFVLNDSGSCQNLDFLSQLEKDVFRTAFEVNQEDVLRLFSHRQRETCQSQSLNLHFDAEEDEEYIAYIHQLAFEDENIHSLYYVRGKAGVSASKGACSSCES
jgi:ribonucleoside-diphosphate reductase alpha chain